MFEGPRYQANRPPHTKKPCTGCGGFRWSADGECLNNPCISDETKEFIFRKRGSKKKRK